MYYDNQNGWLVSSSTGRKEIPLAPPAHNESPVVGQPWPNWTGTGWVMATYSEPAAYVPPTVVNVYDWFIDIGPFFDRFGASKMAILVSADTTVQAIVKDVMARKWVDLQRVDVGQAIDVLIAKGISGVNAGLKTSVLTTPVAEVENLAVRKLYFS